MLSICVFDIRITHDNPITAHAQDRAAQRLMEEPTYGNKPVLNIIHDRGLQVQFVLEQRKENEVMQKCLMKVCFDRLLNSTSV